MNNAHLISAATYHGCIPGFQQLLDSVGGELPRFYQEVRKLSGSKTARLELCSKVSLSQQPARQPLLFSAHSPWK